MEVKKLLDEAFRLISSVPVTGDNVDIMAAARNKLRAVYRALDEDKKDEVKDDG